MTEENKTSFGNHASAEAKNSQKALKCRVSILTNAGGERMLTFRDGELTAAGGKYMISYTDNENAAMFSIDGKHARWVRSGEFAADLSFEEGKTTEGSFGNVGLNGKATIETHAVSAEERKDSVAADLKYTLYFDCGKQKMRVRILARICEETEAILS